MKLDKSFVDTISTSAQQRDLVDGIIKLAHTLRLKVVAEGVETPADRALLVDAGCDFGQGYLFARPMPADAGRRRTGLGARRRAQRPGPRITIP